VTQALLNGVLQWVLVYKLKGDEMTTVVKLNLTGVEWVVYDETMDGYWTGGNRWTQYEAFALSFTSAEAAIEHCEVCLQISPDKED